MGKGKGKGKGKAAEVTGEVVASAAEEVQGPEVQDEDKPLFDEPAPCADVPVEEPVAEVAGFEAIKVHVKDEEIVGAPLEVEDVPVPLNRIPSKLRKFAKGF